MRQHIDTAPIWDSYRQDCECPLCLLYTRTEAASVAYFLGESVMEPSQRVEVNRKGFCVGHFKQMYEAGNRLGLALITDTYMKETINRLKSIVDQARSGAAEGGKAIFRRLGGGKGSGLQEAADTVKAIEDSCLVCERIRENMERYMYTVLYMYKHEAEFPALFEVSKGMCLEHFAQALEMAPKYLSGDMLKRFIDTLCDIEIKNLERVEGELQWFTSKFDYRNQDKPWGNSRDAVKRSVNKLCRQVVNED